MKLYHVNLDEGGDFMNLTVNQDNLYLFLPSKVSWMADMLMEDRHIGCNQNNISIKYLQKIGRRKHETMAFGSGGSLLRFDRRD